MPGEHEKPLYQEMVVEVPIERLHAFQGHPFHIAQDSSLEELVESIRKYGVVEPIIVRPKLDEGYYEIVSGHRRRYAAGLLGIRMVPVIIRMIPDEEAIITMVDANIHRNRILPSEKAEAYRMKYAAMLEIRRKRRGGPIDPEVKGKKTAELVGKEFGDSAKQVQRYIKITELIPELMQKLDNGEISLNPAYELAYLKEEDQKKMAKAIDVTLCAPSLSQAQRIKNLSRERQVTFGELKRILGEAKRGNPDELLIKKKALQKYFSADVSMDEIRVIIMDLLERRKQEKEEENVCVK